MVYCRTFRAFVSSVACMRARTRRLLHTHSTTTTTHTSLSLSHAHTHPRPTLTRTHMCSCPPVLVSCVLCCHLAAAFFVLSLYDDREREKVTAHDAPQSCSSITARTPPNAIIIGAPAFATAAAAVCPRTPCPRNTHTHPPPPIFPALFILTHTAWLESSATAAAHIFCAACHHIHTHNTCAAHTQHTHYTNTRPCTFSAPPRAAAEHVLSKARALAAAAAACFRRSRKFFFGGGRLPSKHGCAPPPCCAAAAAAMLASSSRADNT